MTISPSPSRVVILGGSVTQEEAERLRSRFEAHRLHIEAAKPDAIEDHADVVGLIPIPAFPITRETFASFPRLRVVAAPSVGTDHIDLAAAAAVMLLKDIPLGAELVDDQTWYSRRTHPIELAEATVGLIGFGQIARHAARLLHLLGISTLVWNRSDISGHAEASLVTACSDIDQLLAVSDVVSLHIPLTDSTRHLVDAAFIARMRAGAGLINTGRGGLVDTAALAAALTRGRLRGVVLDVLDPEPPAWQSEPALRSPRTIVTPHQAWLTAGSRHRGFDVAADGVISTLDAQTA